MNETDNTQTITPEVMSSVQLVSSSSQVQLRDQKIREHYGKEGLAQRIEANELSVEELLDVLVIEMAKENDALAGNRLIADENGDIQTSTIISRKRTETIREIAKTVLERKEFNAANSIDVESPSMRIVFKYFLDKCKESFNKSGMSSEISDVFYRNLIDLCVDWKKDLKKKIAELKT